MSDEFNITKGQVFVRTAAEGDFILEHTFDGPILSIVLDPDDWHIASVVVNNSQLNSAIGQTTDAGQTWTNVTGNLGHLALQVDTVTVVHPTSQATATSLNPSKEGISPRHLTVCFERPVSIEPPIFDSGCSMALLSGDMITDFSNRTA